MICGREGEGGGGAISGGVGVGADYCLGLWFSNVTCNVVRCSCDNSHDGIHPPPPLSPSWEKEKVEKTRQTDTQTHRDRETDGQTDRQRQTDRQTEIERQIDTDTETERDTERLHTQR